jgi:phosphoenolpyruvate-protein phosphotransferase (PTS system enzyme I)
MQELSGQRVAEGLAVGMARIIEHKSFKIPQHDLADSDVQGELQLLRRALQDGEKELTMMLQPSFVNDQERDILNTHIEIMRDPELIKNLEESISKDKRPAARAVHEIFSATTAFFEGLGNDMFKQRASDYQDVGNRILAKLMDDGKDVFANLSSEHIPILTEISPTEVSALHRIGIRAFVADSCSANSHAAIISRALGIAVLSSVSGLRAAVKSGSTMILDADSGKVIVDPDDEMLEYFAQRVQVEELIRQKREKLKETDCVTQDGIRIKLYANIGMPEELPAVKDLSCDGIGLFRTEFIYLSRDTLPSEEEQFEIYRKVLSEMAPLPVTIRTFDLGGDKILHLIPSPQESNPYLGNRGIRFSLSHTELFKTQLRAIIRASAFGKVCVMFPMVIDVADFIEARNIFNQCVDELYSEGCDYDSSIAVGAMIEVPSAALCSDALAKECDFFSIGTNDLAQYTLAVDRNSEQVSRYYIAHHPAVLMLIRATVNNAARYHKPVSLCGEMASQAEYVPLLIGMGITELSVNVNAHYNVKTTVQQCDAKLHMIVKNFDFNTSLPEVDKLVYRTLKPYYTKKGRS